MINTIVIDNEGRWWTGLVHDRDHATGKTRLRLERWVENKTGYANPHTWRVRPDYWDEERDAVWKIQKHGGRSPPASLPIDERLTALESLTIRKDDTRWVMAVRVDRPIKGPCVRLYHWDPRDGSTQQKWTVGRNWNDLEALATRHLAMEA